MSDTANNFMTANDLSFRVERVSERPDAMCQWQRDPAQRHWRFEFRTLAHDFAMAGHFSQGSAHKSEPTAAEVLHCLAMDARSFEDCSDVLEFADEFGHDLSTREDRVNVRNTFNACAKASRDLQRLLGDSFDEFLTLEFDE